MNNNSFHLQEILLVVRKNMRSVWVFTIVVGLLGAAALFLVPRKYESTVVLTANNPQITDKAALFNQQIQSLYSGYGSTDDLDRIIGISMLDTLYLAMVDQFKLHLVYRLNALDTLRLRQLAAKKLRKDVQLERTDQQQLKMNVRFKHPDTAASIANAMQQWISKHAMQENKNRYEKIVAVLNEKIKGLEAEYQETTGKISQANTLAQINWLVQDQQRLLQQAQEIRKTKEEFAVGLAAMPELVAVQQVATPNLKHVYPNEWLFIFLFLLGGFATGVLWVIIRNSK
jgi:capsular polysaccharide biosynthesis protein